MVDADDIDILCGHIQAGSQENRYDLDQSGSVDIDDQRYLVETILNTSVGDANLDGIFNSADLVQIFQFGQYQDNTPNNSGWAQGDWNCDGDFNTTDLIVAFQAGGYVRAARIQNIGAALDVIVSVDEPAAEPPIPNDRSHSNPRAADLHVDVAARDLIFKSLDDFDARFRRLVTRSVSEGTSCEKSLAHASGYQNTAFCTHMALSRRGLLHHDVCRQFRKLSEHQEDQEDQP